MFLPAKSFTYVSACRSTPERKVEDAMLYVKCMHTILTTCIVPWQNWNTGGHTAGMHPIRAAQSRQKRQRTAELRFCSDAFYLILYHIHHAPFTLAECRSDH